MNPLPLKIVLCGPSHSGKSCFREGLKQVLLSMHRKGSVPYPYVLTACPDGEGAWYAETVRNNPELAKKLKDDYKKKFTLEFAQLRSEDVKNILLPLTIIDIGGVIDDKNRLIVQFATHAIILSGDLKATPDWKRFCEECSLSIIADLESDYNGITDAISSTKPKVIGKVHHLERGEDVSNRPAIIEVAKFIANMVADKND